MYLAEKNVKIGVEKQLPAPSQAGSGSEIGEASS